MSKKLIRFDWAIKRLLRDKANFGVLEGFLSELLFENIEILQIIESESNQDSEDDKFNRVDILTENSKKELIIIEIQNNYQIDYYQRMIYGVSKTISSNLALGQPYENVKKIISVNILYFDLGQGKDYVYKGKTEFQGLHEKDTLQLNKRQQEKFNKENVSDIFPEYYLLKVNNFNDIAKDSLDEWVYFLKNSEVKNEFNAKGLKKAEEVLDYMRLDDNEKYNYERHLTNLHQKASEMISLQEDAEYKVKLNQNLENALNGIKEGFNNDTISKITKLTFTEIEKLRIELNK